eukprot:scaffold5122_cov120-Isochrysis_galbana.AAC.5
MGPPSASPPLSHTPTRGIESRTRARARHAGYPKGQKGRSQAVERRLGAPYAMDPTLQNLHSGSSAPFFVPVPLLAPRHGHNRQQGRRVEPTAAA